MSLPLPTPTFLPRSHLTPDLSAPRPTSHLPCSTSLLPLYMPPTPFFLTLDKDYQTGVETSGQINFEFCFIVGFLYHSCRHVTVVSFANGGGGGGGFGSALVVVVV